MLIVHDMKVIKTHEKKHFFNVQHLDNETLGIYDNPTERIFARVTRETIKGRRFRNTNGLDVVIGWDEQTQAVLGLPFKAFASMEKRRQHDYEENAQLRKKLRQYKEMTVFEFIKTKIFNK